MPADFKGKVLRKMNHRLWFDQNKKLNMTYFYPRQGGMSKNHVTLLSL